MIIPSPHTKRKARIEIIPLIDIIFFLLATFVMVSLSMVKNKGVSVNLPVAESGTPQERKDYYTISVTQTGEFYINKEHISKEQLAARLQQIKQQNPDPKIFINGDEKAFFGDAIAILDEVRRMGISKVSIQTKPKATAQASPGSK